MFAHSRYATAEAVTRASAAGLPRWVKLSPNAADLVEIAAAGLAAGAEAIVLVNTLFGMAIDAEQWGYRLGSGAHGGGLSGPAIRPVALRAVHDCRQAFPRGAPGPAGPPVSIVGVGGVSSGLDAVELMMAGADAVEVGTATMRDPRATAKVIAELSRWCSRHGVSHVRELVGGVHMTRGARIDPGGRRRTAKSGRRIDGGKGMTLPGDSAREHLAIALDMDDLVAAMRTARPLLDYFAVAKVGLELFSAAGPEAVASLSAEGFQVFVDLKIHDIPTTAASCGAGTRRSRGRVRHGAYLGRPGDGRGDSRRDVARGGVGRTWEPLRSRSDGAHERPRCAG